MKKYYETTLCQVTKGQGYFKNGNRYNESVLPHQSVDGNYYSDSYYPLNKIIVEKISSYHVREVKTGLIFPIMNVRYGPQPPSYKNIFFVECKGNIHTYVFQYNDTENYFYEVTSYKKLKEYDDQHPDPKEYKQQLLNTYIIGESYMNNKLALEVSKNEPIKQQPKTKKTDEEKEEQRKIRVLKRQFKIGRKNL